MTDDAIRFQAQVYKVQTTIDGGIRLTLDLPESSIDTAGELMRCRLAGAMLEIAAIPVIQKVEDEFTRR